MRKLYKTILTTTTSLILPTVVWAQSAQIKTPSPASQLSYKVNSAIDVSATDAQSNTYRDAYVENYIAASLPLTPNLKGQVRQYFIRSQREDQVGDMALVAKHKLTPVQKMEYRFYVPINEGTRESGLYQARAYWFNKISIDKNWVINTEVNPRAYFYSNEPESARLYRMAAGAGLHYMLNENNSIFIQQYLQHDKHHFNRFAENPLREVNTVMPGIGLLLSPISNLDVFFLYEQEHVNGSNESFEILSAKNSHYVLEVGYSF